jgi:hypothetical protein
LLKNLTSVKNKKPLKEISLVFLFESDKNFAGAVFKKPPIFMLFRV